MQLSVRDLGEERFVTLLGRALLSLQTSASGRPYGQTTPPVTASGRFARAPRRLSRYWTRPLNLPDEQAQRLSDQIWAGPYGNTIRAFFFVMIVHSLIPLTLGLANAVTPALFAALFFSCLWGSIILAMIVAPRQQCKLIGERNLTVEEVESLLPTARGRLERQYLGLVLDALRTEVPTVSAQSDIRAALRHLGDVISRLPSDPVAVQETDSLRREAQALRQEAARESDAFIEGSLQRQAEMLEQRATMAAQNGRAARRVAALRREARTQMDNLRAVLVGFQQTPMQDAASVSHLSAALHRVAGEAKAVALARQELENEELERMYGRPLPSIEEVAAASAPIAVSTPQAAQVTVGKPTTTTTATPSGQSSGSNTRPWWRNNGTAG